MKICGVPRDNSSPKNLLNTVDVDEYAHARGATSALLIRTEGDSRQINAIDRDNQEYFPCRNSVTQGSVAESNDFHYSESLIPSRNQA